MTLAELVAMIHAVPGGCVVEVTSTNSTGSLRGQPYGVVRWGHNEECRRVFHDEAELRGILEVAKK